MNRPALTSVLILTLVALLGCNSAPENPETRELRGVYLELSDNIDFGAYPLLEGGDWRKLFRGLKQFGVNAIFPNVVTPSGAVYPSKVVPVKPESVRLGHDDLLAVLVAAAHDEGLEIHPWTIEWYHAPEDTDPGLLVQSADGKTSHTLCPSQPANRELMSRMILELVENYDLDGVQYDYMRLPGSDYCYCPACRAAFEHCQGAEVENWPADVLEGGVLEKEYTAYLEDNISAFVREMYPRIKKIKPGIVVSGAVWCHQSLARNPEVRQNWGEWVEYGWLDFIAPMNYGNKWVTDHFADFARSEAGHVVGKMPLVFGMGAYLDTPESLVEDIGLGRCLGGDGFIIYTLTKKIFTEHLPVLSREVWSSPAGVPDFQD